MNIGLSIQTMNVSAHPIYIQKKLVILTFHKKVVKLTSSRNFTPKF